MQPPLEDNSTEPSRRWIFKQLVIIMLVEIVKKSVVPAKLEHLDLSPSGTMLLAHEEHSFIGSECVAHDTLDLT